MKLPTRSPILLLTVFWLTSPCYGQNPKPSAGEETGIVSKERIVLHVSTKQQDAADGSAERPFNSLAAARDAIRALKQEGRYPDGGVLVNILAGRYVMHRMLDFAQEDSGTPAGPVVWRGAANGATTLTGGLDLPSSEFSPVTDNAVLSRLPEEAQGKVLQADLGKLGDTKFDPMPLFGHGMHALHEVTKFRSGRPSMELFADGKAMTVSRWPNESYGLVAAVVEEGSKPRLWQKDMEGMTASFGGAYLPPDQRENPPKGFAVKMDSERPLRWRTAPDAMLFGYWWWDWSDQAVEIARVDEDGTIRSVQPSAYGVRTNQRFYVYNLLEELDQPGEWYLDRQAGRLYLIPPSGALDNVRLELSLLASPFLHLKNTSHVQIENLVFTTARGQAVWVEGGESVQLSGCTLQQLGGNAVSVYGGQNHSVVNCTIRSTGARGIQLAGGDRKTLTPGGHFAKNNTIRNFGRVAKTYTPAISLTGVGNRAVANRISDGPASAIQFAGNDHVIEGNEISKVCREADDMGAIYSGRDHTARGTVIRNNYLHQIQSNSAAGCGVHGVYLDDMLSGVEITGNLFLDIGGANVVINGGRDNIVTGNTFLISPEAAAIAKARKSSHGRFAAVSISDLGMDERGGIREGKPINNPENVDHLSAPYAKYAGLANLLSDEPRQPKHNHVTGNLCAGIPLFYFHRFKTNNTEAEITSWNTIKNNTVFMPGLEPVSYRDGEPLAKPPLPPQLQDHNAEQN